MTIFVVNVTKFVTSFLRSYSLPARVATAIGCFFRKNVVNTSLSPTFPPETANSGDCVASGRHGRVVTFLQAKKFPARTNLAGTMESNSEKLREQLLLEDIGYTKPSAQRGLGDTTGYRAKGLGRLLLVLGDKIAQRGGDAACLGRAA